MLIILVYLHEVFHAKTGNQIYNKRPVFSIGDDWEGRRVSGMRKRGQFMAYLVTKRQWSIQFG